ncbi:hypothetical protein DUI87_00944 [Hirundo rustica rustica]|uniref:Integrase catalytic domain-containing protein n=1 Tax=Hirundo rustica rustica TaxID=333673 RepID=A0A3M0L411_HIRRU|nr:hypothetical protein DUI87_00944 [Hirundo rustica rustica]
MRLLSRGQEAFASLGVPQEIKTDNGPTYIGKVLDKFLKRWGVHHTFGIPHSPTGIRQAMDKVAKEVFLVQTGGGDVGVQGIPLVALEGQGPGQGGLGPQPRAQRDTGFDFSPWEKLPTLREGLQATRM